MYRKDVMDILAQFPDEAKILQSDEDVMSLNKKCYSIIYNDLIKYDNRKKGI